MLRGMDARRLGGLHRTLRHRLGLRQVDVAKRSRVSRNKISDIELGRLDGVPAGDLERSFAALEAKLAYTVSRRGAELDRLLDEGHARLASLVASILRGFGWLVEVEVTFARCGDRGSIDLLAWHPATRTLLVIEIKTEIGSIEGLLRPLDMKVRQAARTAIERFKWQPAVVARLVALPESSANRRLVAGHADLLRVALPDRSRAVRAWLRQPTGSLRGLWFLSAAADVGVKRNPSAVRRIRRPGMPASESGHAVFQSARCR